VRLLKTLGVDGSQAWDAIANMAFAQKPEADANFKRQWAGDDGGTSTELEELKRANDDLRKRLDARDQDEALARKRTEAETQIGAYIDGEVVGAVTEKKHPLLTRMLKNNAAGAKTRLRKVADEMADKLRRVPEPIEVTRELERRLREDVTHLGLAVDTTKPKPTADKTGTAKQNLAKSKPRAQEARDEDDEALDDPDLDDDTFMARLKARDAKKKSAEKGKKKASA